MVRTCGPQHAHYGRKQSDTERQPLSKLGESNKASQLRRMTAFNKTGTEQIGGQDDHRDYREGRTAPDAVTKQGLRADNQQQDDEHVEKAQAKLLEHLSEVVLHAAPFELCHPERRGARRHQVALKFATSVWKPGTRGRP